METKMLSNSKNNHTIIVHARLKFTRLNQMLGMTYLGLFEEL